MEFTWCERLEERVGISDMVDEYGRTIDYIRISVTDRCNLRCRYCMPEDGISLASHQEILRFHEIERLAESLCQWESEKSN